ncbi:MAG TPA: AAA family ATPase, partial [Thermomicrobiales bacterium]|nr:AAA family ATPase [Thermomicrobiales bacterium]
MDLAPSLDRLVTPSSGFPLLGRERELAVLRDGLAASIGGESRVLFLVGEPGIGKTRLAEELARDATAVGADVLWGSCYEWEGAPASWPWIQLIRRHAETRESASLRSDLGPGGAEVAQIVPMLRERLPGLPVPPPGEPEAARFRLFDAIAVLLRSAAAHRPLILVLDDLHWADRPSILLLAFLARELRDARVLLVGTYRDVEVGRDHPLAPPLADIQCAPRCRRLPLSGLTESDVARFVDLIAGSGASPELVAAVYRETGGNPFFVTEVVRLLADEGSLAAIRQTDPRPIGLPPTVRETIRQRLHRLAPECLRVLTIAAVVGREFGLPVLCRVADLPPDLVADHVSEAVDARLIHDTATPAGYRFTHALVQETLVAELNPGQRARLHRHVGEALERFHAANLDPHVAELAHHFAQAAIAGETDRAIEYAVKAAEQARAQIAFESVVEHYQRALRTLDLAPLVDDIRRLRSEPVLLAASVTSPLA